MINKREITAILVATIMISFAITLVSSVNAFLITSLTILAVIIVNTIAKKVLAYYLEADVEVKLWEFRRYGFAPHSHFKKPFPAGAAFPIISKILLFPINGFVWMASLVFDVKPTVYRAAKRHGYYSYTEISEDHLAYIAGIGIFANLGLAVIGYLLGFSEFAKFSIWFAFFNMIPLSNLDGNKIFFGSKTLWSFLGAITLIALAYTFLII